LVPRKTPTIILWAKSTTGSFAIGSCSFHSAAHSAAVRMITCLAFCCPLTSPLATVAKGVCAAAATMSQAANTVATYLTSN